nr:receptor like protein 23-like isoform X2 [Danaus plexippus plexippus]
MTIIEDTTLDLFINLRHLYLKFNKIRRFSISPFSTLIFLENLDLSFNRITQLKTSNFRGLVTLNTLCLSYNNIESMESFDEDLSNLKLLDLSHNKLQNILNEHLINLKELTVLYLAYNNIKYLSATSFNNLNKIVKIDLEHNKLQTIPLELLTSIENHIQDISIQDNVIICRCQKNNTWTWIQDHPKIIKQYAVTCFNEDYPKEKCDLPFIVQLSADKQDDNSVLITWLIRNRTSVKALHVLYYNEITFSDVKLKHVDLNSTSTLITDLEPNMNYMACLLTMYDNSVINLLNEDFIGINRTDFETNITAKMNRNIAASLIAQSTASECVTFDTIKKPLIIKTKSGKDYKTSSILNRRTGLIVGCSLGFIVFFVMVTVLLYTKFKERKRIAKSDPAWSEMNDYHSIQSKEDIIQHSTTASTDNILLGMTKNRNVSFDKII